MVDRVHAIRDLSIADLVKSETGDEYSVLRNGCYLGSFVRVGGTYHFRDQKQNTWVCVCSDIDTGADDIGRAVEFMSY